MSGVIPIFKRGHVEIHGGIVLSATVTDENGTRPDCSNIGQYRFFLDLIEPNGGRLSIWSGRSYEDAIRQGESAGRENAISVHDLIVGGAK